VTLLEPSLNDPRQGDEVRLVFSGALYSLTTKILNPANRRDEARAACVRAADLLRQSVERFPAVPIYRQRLAECLAQVSALSNALGDPAETEAALFEAIELWRSLVDEAPANAVYRERLAKLLHIRAQAIPIEADDQAEPLFREAMALRQTLVAESPDSPQRGSELAATMNNLARILMRKGELVEARDLLHQAIELQQAAVAAQPGNVIFQRFLENHRHSLAEVEEQLKPETSLPEAAHDGHAEKDEIDAN
jgi:tetratricopeptide (TPR) repeat protein